MVQNTRRLRFRYFKTGIVTLDAILKKGIRCLPGKGMLGLIVGPAGAGKSILALHMCCSFLLDRRTPAPAPNGKLSHPVMSDEQVQIVRPFAAVYITHEESDLVEAKVRDFNYFQKTLPTERNKKGASSEDTPPFFVQENSLDSLLTDPDHPCTLHICRVGLDENSQSRVLQNIFDTISQRIRWLKDKDDDETPRQKEHGGMPRKIDHRQADPLGSVLVCVDNVRTIHEEALGTAMGGVADPAAKDCQEDPHDGNFYKRLHRDCVNGHVHTFLIMEEDLPEETYSERYDIAHRPEVFAADMVIRLGIRTYSTEYRERFLQIVKAKHQFYYRGKHHFSIISKGGGGRKQEQEEERGIVIYPSIPMQLSLLQIEKQKRRKREDARAKQEKPGKSVSPDRLKLGIHELDEKIAGTICPDTPEAGYIRPHTNSVLVCDLDAMATIIALHFAVRGGPACAGGPDSPGVFISFKHKREDIVGLAQRFFSPEEIDALQILDFPPEYISGHKLLRDIMKLIDKSAPRQKLGNRATRVVVDNVFELRCKYPLITDARGFLASLFEMFSGTGVTSLVVDTVEVGEGRNPIESSFAAGLADNVFLLRHVEFHSRPHRVFSVLKLVDLHTPDNLWDLEETRRLDRKYELAAGDTFALYKNVLAGCPEPITIIFSFYNDEKDSPFHVYLKGQSEALRHSFGENLNVNLYGAHEYTRVQNLLARAEKLPRGDCHIVALDEFWLKRLIDEARLEDLSEAVRKLWKNDRTTADKGQYVSAAHDIALHQLTRNERNRTPSICRERQAEEGYYRTWYAIPARNNYGVLCFDRATIRTRFADLDDLDKTLKSWVENPGSRSITWKDLVDLRESSERTRRNAGRIAHHIPRTFFTFCMDQLESCVSLLLELALSHIVPDNKFLVSNRQRFRLEMNIKEFPIDAILTLLALLDDGELRQLASGTFRPSAQEPPAMFTRQWMSTLGCLRARMTSSTPEYHGYFQKLEPYELPIGGDGHPTPVSGTWYLGVLDGSSAIETGVSLIRQFTSPEDELYKLTNYIGFPVRRGFYEDQSGYDLPYHKRFIELADVQKRFIDMPSDANTKANYERELLEKGYPLYRMLIHDYENLAPILWRLMVKAARETLAQSPANGDLREGIENLIKTAASEYTAVQSPETDEN